MIKNNPQFVASTLACMDLSGGFLSVGPLPTMSKPVSAWGLSAIAINMAGPMVPNSVAAGDNRINYIRTDGWENRQV